MPKTADHETRSDHQQYTQRRFRADQQLAEVQAGTARRRASSAFAHCFLQIGRRCMHRGQQSEDRTGDDDQYACETQHGCIHPDLTGAWNAAGV